MDEPSSPDRLSPAHAFSLILTFCAISGIFIYLIISKNIVFGSGGGNWVYGYLDQKASLPLWIPAAGFSLIGALIFLGSRMIRGHEKITLIGCFLIAVGLQVILQSIYPIRMDRIVSSDIANSFYTAALEHSPGEILSQFSTLAPDLPLHARTNMPGKILLFQFLTLFSKDPQILGYLIIAVSSLGGLLLYGICKSLFQDRRTALYAFVLYTLIPAKQEFLPILNTVTPVFILLSLYLFLAYLDTKKRRYLVLLGISLYILVLFEPSPLVTGILFAGILAHAIVHRKITWKEIAGLVLIPLLSFAATYLLFWWIFSFDLWQAFQHIWTDASDFNDREHRGYVVWLRENVKEFFYAVGLPVGMVFVYCAFDLLARWKEIIRGARRWPLEWFYTCGLILTFGAVLFLGINRGEVTRLWIYLAVFFQVPAALFMAKQVKSNALFFILAGTILFQTMISLQRIRFIL